jgi:hypothetical protein
MLPTGASAFSALSVVNPVSFGRPPRRRRNHAQAALFDTTPQHAWQKRFYDFNVWTERKRIEKLRYMHQNPVKRGLVTLSGTLALEQLSCLLAGRNWYRSSQ